jgi:hypothetical protein
LRDRRGEVKIRERVDEKGQNEYLGGRIMDFSTGKVRGQE